MLEAPPSDDRLKIIHVFRAPLGGLFRHVLDLTRAQIERGHHVGIICDSLTGGDRTDSVLAELAPRLDLGLVRLPMRRNPHPTDIGNLARIRKLMRHLQPDVIHGHGSKGGLYARLPGFLPGAAPAIRAYTPHGGSFNYRPGSYLHRIYMATESVLARATDIFLFESAFIQSCFIRYVHAPGAFTRVIPNGISEAEYVPVTANADAADFLYVGELRSAKGIDTLLDAHLEFELRTHRRIRTVLVGSGPDKEELQAQALRNGLNGRVTFPGPMPAREAFRLGHTLIVPSRAESLPYIVLEAAAARLPMISTSVGGIPEIFGPYAGRLIPSNEPSTLASAMIDQAGKSDGAIAREAGLLADYVASRFTIHQMVDAVIEGYRAALARKLPSMGDNGRTTALAF
ncbi:glycosyltransferase family 4 protein [Methylocella sp. CPCC 101449]|uniref:glycosyltransferase family 4 protein n=1 Tax=Methylocella sp. CPCC 101449 TaxID=2987531 RepID=UPI00288C90FA|nr:glycosyltransferase family 4 protein [Methylocella sp. CPCC 101449]MDT2022439.1 glycosyltransferase family 4 protein [Methylocella sp. CPCC 101449]